MLLRPAVDLCFDQPASPGEAGASTEINKEANGEASLAALRTGKAVVCFQRALIIHEPEGARASGYLKRRSSKRPKYEILSTFRFWPKFPDIRDMRDVRGARHVNRD